MKYRKLVYPKDLGNMPIKSIEPNPTKHNEHYAHVLETESGDTPPEVAS